MNALSRFARSEHASVATAEFIVFTTVVVAGMLAGLEGLRDLMNTKLHGMSQAVRGFDQATGSPGEVTQDWVSRIPITEAELQPFATYEIPDE